MNKLYNIVMGIMYTMIGILVLSCIIILFYDKLEFLHPSSENDKNSGSKNIKGEEIFIDNDDYNTIEFPVSAVKAMDLVDRFANPYANKRYEYGEIVEINEKEYHAIYSAGSVPLMVERNRGYFLLL